LTSELPGWTAEIRVDEELAARLVRAQFRLGESVRPSSEGWDYVVYRVDDEWTFRFPRRAAVVPGTERELTVLPQLSLPVEIPKPVHVGRPSHDYPWPFYGAHFISGREAVGLTDGERLALARPLGRALAVLHRTAVDASLPDDPIHRADMRVRVPRTRDVLAMLGLEAEPILERAERLPPPVPTSVCHGDLHFRQLLVDDGELAGIIDWVDLCRSDPGVDLQLAWSFFPPEGREDFLDEYGTVDEQSLLRARVLALFLNGILARYARDEGLPAIEEEASSGLMRALVES
jgi:aminoglycoside phosphotransferase (APT) family kinase protein